MTVLGEGCPGVLDSKEFRTLVIFARNCFEGTMRRTPKTLSVTIMLALSCLMALGCRSHQLERSFFDKPPGDRLERLRQYSLADQYKIFRYGNDAIEPPVMELADPIAERGAAAVPFLMEKLNANADDIAVRDILWIFETMESSGTYKVKADTRLMDVLVSKVSGMKDKGWHAICLADLQRIRGQR
jgi:hypothetical protein